MADGSGGETRRMVRRRPGPAALDGHQIRLDPLLTREIETDGGVEDLSPRPSVFQEALRRDGRPADGPPRGRGNPKDRDADKEWLGMCDMMVVSYRMVLARRKLLRGSEQQCLEEGDSPPIMPRGCDGIPGDAY